MLRKRMGFGATRGDGTKRRAGWLRLLGPLILGVGMLAAPIAPARSHDGYLQGGAGCDPKAPLDWISMSCMAGVTQYGNYLEFTRRYMWVAYPHYTHGYQAQEQLIVHNGAPCGTTYLRWGLARGTPNGQDGYLFFLAERDNVGNDFWWNMGGTNWDGGNNAYYMRYAGATPFGGRYDVYKDGTGTGNIVFTTANQGYGTCRAFSGGSLKNYNYPPDATMRIEHFDLRNRQWQTTSYAWRIGWYTSDLAIESYCPTHPNPYCFNGSHYGSTQWTNNKL